jgi:RimJ/RimL family protein N-acetyltransferase
MMARSVMALTVPDLHDDLIRLRPPAPDDVAALTAALQDPEISRFTMIPSPYTAADAVAFVARADAEWRAGTRANFLIVSADDDGLLGGIGLHEEEPSGDRPFGYWVAAPARRRGVATRAVRLFVDWAFGTLGLPRLHALVFTDNPVSSHLLERAGFRCEGPAPVAIAHATGRRSAIVLSRVAPVSAGAETRRPAAP